MSPSRGAQPLSTGSSEPVPQCPSRHTRGAQPGNLNAYKHGFYRSCPPDPSSVCGRSPGGQPGNLNALRHGATSRLLRQAAQSAPAHLQVLFPLTFHFLKSIEDLGPEGSAGDSEVLCKGRDAAAEGAAFARLLHQFSSTFLALLNSERN
jgi:hypothetical protein